MRQPHPGDGAVGRRRRRMRAKQACSPTSTPTSGPSYWTSHAIARPCTTSSPSAHAVIDDHVSAVRRGEPTSGCGVLLDHPVRPRRARRHAERQEHQRVPRQWLGIPHAQPRRPGQAAAEGPGPLPCRLRGRSRRGAVRGFVVVRSIAPLETANSSIVSAQAVLVSRADCILGRFITGEIAPEGTRDDYDQQGPASFFACRDGHVYLYMTNRRALGPAQGTHGPSALAGRIRRRLARVLRDAGEGRDVSPWVCAVDHATRRRMPSPIRLSALGVPLVPVNGADDLRAFAAVPPPRLLPRRRTSGARHGGVSHRALHDECVAGRDHLPAHRLSDSTRRKCSLRFDIASATVDRQVAATQASRRHRAAARWKACASSNSPRCGPVRMPASCWRSSAPR